MAQAYCEVCAVEVTVRGGRCLVGHPVEETPKPSRPGRHRAGRAAAPRRQRSSRPLEPPASSPGPPLGSASHRGADQRLPVLEILGFTEPGSHVATGPPPSPARGSTGPREERGAVQTLPRAEAWAVRLSDLATDDEEEVDTGKLIQRLWEASDTERVQDDHAWAPEEFSPAARSGRSFRWSVVILVLLLIGGGVALLVAAATVPEQQAQAVAAGYRTNLASLGEVVDPAEEAAGVITDPSAGAAQLSEAVLPLARLEARALDTVAVATRPLPRPPPLAFRDPIDALVPVRQELQRTGEVAQTIADRLTAVLDYRLLMGRSFRLPPLPLSATPDEASELGVDLAVALADTIDILSRLPDDPFFEAHRAQAERAVQELEELQASYLDALRQEDVDRATALVAEINQKVADTKDLSQPLAEADAWAKDALGELRRLLAQTESVLETTG